MQIVCGGNLQHTGITCLLLGDQAYLESVKLPVRRKPNVLVCVSQALIILSETWLVQFPMRYCFFGTCIV